MSDPDPDPREVLSVAGACSGVAELLEPRDVPLGGPRAMTVRRTLPQRRRSLIGPWCFADHFGPDDVRATGGMVVPRHPHTGLATVTLLFRGHIDHLDSTGFGTTVRPGEVNLMIAGAGVSHSEFSTADTTILHGVQLWYALPDALRHGAPQSQHHVAGTVGVPGGEVTTCLGHVLGIGGTSPVDTRTPALAAELTIRPEERLDLLLDPTFEHGLLLDDGAIDAHVGDAAIPVAPGRLLHLAAGARGVGLRARGEHPARLVLIGGPPFAEEIVMWWNFVGRSHAEIVRARERWMAEIGAGGVAPPGAATASDPATGHAPHPAEHAAIDDAPHAAGLFGPFPAGTPAPLPAPELPRAQIRPRRRPGGTPS